MCKDINMDIEYNIDEEEGVEYYKLKGDEWDLNPHKLEPQSRALPLCYHHHE